MGSDQSDGRRSGSTTGSTWSREQAARIDRTADAVAPIIYPPSEDPVPEYHIWDTWLLRDRDGTVADIDGYRFAFSLTAPADLLPGKRHDVAQIRWFSSADGRSWRDHGPVFDDALGQRQWAGSALYDDGDVYLFYTAAGEDGAEELTYTQRIAGAGGCRLRVEDGIVAFHGDWEHHELLRPDGERYEREGQSRGMIYTFRDPWCFEDPATGETVMLFEANTPVPEGSDACDGDPEQQSFNGCVGLARSPSGDLLEWELADPVLDAVCVNQELERPHIVVRDGQYYLFVSSHRHTFAPGLSGYDGLYGFVADSLTGPYTPLNGSGLVATNPGNAPFQSYSWMAFPHPEAVFVQSFFNYYDFDAESMDAVAGLSESEQRRRFGGTLAPTLRLDVDGTNTRIVGTLDHWHVPLAGEELPPLDSELFDRVRRADRGHQGYPTR